MMHAARASWSRSAHLRPTLQEVARSNYRLRLLNGCNSRTLRVSFR